MPRGKKEPASEFATLMNALVFAQTPEVDEEEVLAEHPALMDMLVQAGRDGGFTPESVIENAPEEFQDGGDNEDVGSRLELAGFLHRATERCELTPLSEMVDAKPKKKKAKPAATATKPAVSSKGPRAESATAKLMSIFVDKATATQMIKDAGGAKTLLDKLQKRSGLEDLTYANLMYVVRTKLKIKLRG